MSFRQKASLNLFFANYSVFVEVGIPEVIQTVIIGPVYPYNEDHIFGRWPTAFRESLDPFQLTTSSLGSMLEGYNRLLEKSKREISGNCLL